MSEHRLAEHLLALAFSPPQLSVRGNQLTKGVAVRENRDRLLEGLQILLGQRDSRWPAVDGNCDSLMLPRPAPRLPGLLEQVVRDGPGFFACVSAPYHARDRSYMKRS